MSSTSADRLTKLPAEILREIIVQLETKSSIDRFLEAYPSLLKLYSSYERGILESILADVFADDVGGSIRKDVVAIIKFSNRQRKFWRQVTRQVNPEEWEWPDWPRSPKIGYLQKAHRLFSRIIEFIEDYISKAISEYPPRAYLGLPDLKTGKASFMGSLLETRFLPFTSLRRSERYRLLRAFVRYELLCEIHNTRDDKWDVPDGFRNFNSFGTPNAPDPKALLSVHEYYAGLYGAVFAHCGDAWLPDLPSSLSADAAEKAINSSTLGDHPLQFPDDLFFDAQEYYEDLDISCHKVAAELAGCGLDLLTRVLSCMQGHPARERYIKRWLEDLTEDQTYDFESWMKSQYDPRHDKEYSAYIELIISSRFSNELPVKVEEIKRINEYLFGDGSSVSAPRWAKAHKLQIRIYQQRAWGFFDDQRFYPDCHFPSLESLVELQGEDGMVSLVDTHKERRRRRSKHWQDYWTGRADEPVSLTYHEGPGSRFFDDTVAPRDLPWIRGEYPTTDP